MDIVNVEDLALDFTLPGYDIELRVCDLWISLRRLLLTYFQ